MGDISVGDGGDISVGDGGDVSVSFVSSDVSSEEIIWKSYILTFLMISGKSVILDKHGGCMTNMVIS